MADNIFINRPPAKAYDIPYQAAPPPSNPVVRGVALHYLAQLVASSGLVQGILWSNAGFGGLRDKPELEHIEPRYEPTVIKSSGSSKAAAAAATADSSRYLSDIAGEDWAAKTPRKLVFNSTLQYHEAYRDGRLTPTQVAETLLPLIRRDGGKTATQHSIAFLSTKVELVRKAAEESTARYKAGKPLSPLDGVPMAVKDEEDLTGYPKCLGSKLDFAHEADATSFCVQKWLDAGALCVGKTTMHELGMDTTNINPNYGTPRNPNNEQYYCGGSSGGSAYAVAAGLMPFAMGNDGGGSIRIPSGYCGLFGLKPSHGRISARPSSNLAKSTGVPGPLAANMVDLELAYRVMAQPDALNPDSALFAPPQAHNNKTGSGRRKVLGIYRTWFDRADAQVQKVCWEALDYLTSRLGYEIVDITLPLIHEGQMAHAMTILAEIASGTPSTKALTPPNKILLSLGKKTPGVDLLQAQKLRNLLMQHLAHLYDAHHPRGLIIVTPTTPNAGWRLHEGDLKYGCSDGNTQVRNMEYAWLANFVGCPAISLPVGFVDGGVPIGLMGMAEWGGEDGLIGFGYDGEEWLHEEGGRRRERPGNFVDVLGVAGRS